MKIGLLNHTCKCPEVGLGNDNEHVNEEEDMQGRYRVKPEQSCRMEASTEHGLAGQGRNLCFVQLPTRESLEEPKIQREIIPSLMHSRLHMVSFIVNTLFQHQTKYVSNRDSGNIIFT